MKLGPIEMRIREFLNHLPPLILYGLPNNLKDFTVIGPTTNLIKFHYGNPAIHYEVWVQRKRGIIEVGLHFEADRVTNQKHLETLSNHFIEIHTNLGFEIEPEQWTESWTRIHLTLGFQTLDKNLAIKIATKITRMIAVLQPFLEPIK
jgi:hypothetical protein